MKNPSIPSGASNTKSCKMNINNPRDNSKLYKMIFFFIIVASLIVSEYQHRYILSYNDKDGKKFLLKNKPQIK